MTPADVDNLVNSTRESMLKTLLDMAREHRKEVDGKVKPNATSTAVEL